MKRKFNKYQRKEIAKFLKLVHGKERVNLFDVFSAHPILSPCMDVGLQNVRLRGSALSDGSTAITSVICRSQNQWQRWLASPLCSDYDPANHLIMQKNLMQVVGTIEYCHRLCHPSASFDLFLSCIARYAPSSHNQNLLKG